MTLEDHFPSRIRMHPCREPQRLTPRDVLSLSLSPSASFVFVHFLPMQACGKYGLAYEKGIYPEDVLKYYGASEYGSGPPALGTRSPRESYDPEAEDFSRERGSYQNPPEHP